MTGCFVYGLHDAGRVVLVSREGTEHRVDHTHHHSRRDALATHVAYAEEQLLIANIVVIQVTTHLTRRHQRTVDFHVVMLQQVMGQHALLYLEGHVQLSIDTLLFGIRLTQTLEVTRGTPHDESNQNKTSYHQCQEIPTYPGQLAEHFFVVQCTDQDPVRIAAYWTVEHMMLIALLVFEGVITRPILVNIHVCTYRLEQGAIVASQ